jgi:hypothetical protein
MDEPPIRPLPPFLELSVDPEEWIDSLPPKVAAVARQYPPTQCYRSTEHPRLHYAIRCYEEPEHRPVTLKLMHGADSTLPGSSSSATAASGSSRVQSLRRGRVPPWMRWRPSGARASGRTKRAMKPITCICGRALWDYARKVQGGEFIVCIYCTQLMLVVRDGAAVPIELRHVRSEETRLQILVSQKLARVFCPVCEKSLRACALAGTCGRQLPE